MDNCDSKKKWVLTSAEIQKPRKHNMALSNCTIRRQLKTIGCIAGSPNENDYYVKQNTTKSC